VEILHPISEALRKRLVPPDEALALLKPGMRIFLSSGPAEPRTLVRHLMTSDDLNLLDLDLIQGISLGDAISPEALAQRKYRLKTFFGGWVASDRFAEGRIDLIPSPVADIPRLIASGAIRVDVAFVQVTPPDEHGLVSLGLAVNAARAAIAQAGLVIGEVNPHLPRTLGDTFVPIDEFDLLVEATQPPITAGRWTVDETYDRIARNVASLIPDGSCINYNVGPLFDGLVPHLSVRRELGLHSHLFTDAAADLVRSGAVTNRRKTTFRGKAVASFAMGTPELYTWLDGNPLVEFQDLDMSIDPGQMARNDDLRVLLSVRRVDVAGRVALHVGKGNITDGPGEPFDLLVAARLSRRGRSIIALPSRNRGGHPNVRVSVEGTPNLLPNAEAIDFVVTEQGIAHLRGHTVRERAQALIDIAHPDDREALVAEAKAARILYEDQIYLAGSGHLYPADVERTETFKGGLDVRFRAIRPSDEEAMRRLFYRFSDDAVYYRYFSPITAMPHSRMQAYVNVDFRDTMSIVGEIGEPGSEKLIAEGRWAKHPSTPYADVAFIVDETYQGLGIATFLFEYLIKLARERDLRGFTADVLASNKAMMRVFERAPIPVQASLDEGIYELEMPFDEKDPAIAKGIRYSGV
jgi:acyl-CoA hydrolase/RimJ/RimL family protein N-acetyltransferase